MEVGQGPALLLTADTTHQHRLAGRCWAAQHRGTRHVQWHRAAHTSSPRGAGFAVLQAEGKGKARRSSRRCRWLGGGKGAPMEIQLGPQHGREWRRL